MNPAQKKYEAFCKSHLDIPFSMTADWLNMVVKTENWNVALTEKGGWIVGALPYVHKKKWGFSKCVVPPLTTYLGPYIIYPEDQKIPSRIGYEKEIMNDLISQISSFDSIDLKFPPNVTNWQPWYWNAFKETTGYTYLLDIQTSEDELLSGFSENTRRNIRKVEKVSKVFDTDDIMKLVGIKEKALSKKGQKLTIDKSYFEGINQYIKSTERARILSIYNKDQNLLAILLLVWDRDTAYYLYGASNPGFDSSGAMALLLWEAIKISKENGQKTFNFEGSMIESVERFFRGFGGIQTPYFVVRKTTSKWLKLIEMIKGQ